MKRKYNILLGDYYTRYWKYLGSFLEDPDFEFWGYNKEDHEHGVNPVNSKNIEKTCKENKIDLILSKECSINNFIYKPFSHVAKKLKIPHVSLFDGIIDFPYAKRDLTVFEKLSFGVKLFFMGSDRTFQKYIGLCLRNLGLVGFVKYQLHNLSKDKNRYLEDNTQNFVNGDILFEMYPFLKKDKKRFTVLGLRQLDQFVQKKISSKEKSKTVVIIAQPWICDNLLTKEEFEIFKKQIVEMCKNNSGYEFSYRAHHKDDVLLYPEFDKVPNLHIDTRETIDLDEQITESEFVIGLFSSAIANAIWFKKKLIIWNFLNKTDKSIYNRDIFYRETDVSKLKFKDVDKFFKKFNYKKKFDEFYKKIAYHEKKTVAERFKKEIIKLIK